MSVAQLSITFLLQLLVILAACRIFGWIVRRYFGQPQVVGEIVAGIALGPSLFGLVAPDLQQMLFPQELRGLLHVCAQIGIGLCMFVIGLGFRGDQLRGHGRSAFAVSLSGVVAPIVVAMLLTPWLLGVPGLFGQGVVLSQATLFMAAAMSITALPVLARILHERGLLDSRLAAISLSAGAMGDVAAWIMLAVILAGFGAGGGWQSVVVTVVGTGAFTLFLMTIGRRWLAVLGRVVERRGRLDAGMLALVLLLFSGAALTTEALGVHAVFGGFLIGLVMPRGLFVEEVRRRIEPVTLVVLAPLFFVSSGLDTEMMALADVSLFMPATVVLIASIIAKVGACWAAARLTGQDNSTALGVGALMNARGMMELILINIGLQAGLIGPALFSILVLMTVVTTLMTSPLFALTYGRAARAGGPLNGVNEGGDTEFMPASPAAIRNR